MKNEDLKITTTCGSGPGGQHRNRTESCVTVEHIPTGLKEKCEDTPSQHRNLKIAKERLSKKLNSLKDDNKRKAKDELRNSILQKMERIKTYNFKTNTVKDHRTGKVANLQKILDGNLDLLK